AKVVGIDFALSRPGRWPSPTGPKAPRRRRRKPRRRAQSAPPDRWDDAVEDQDGRTKCTDSERHAVAPPLPDEVPATDLAESGQCEQAKRHRHAHWESFPSRTASGVFIAGTNPSRVASYRPLRVRTARRSPRTSASRRPRIGPPSP